MLESIPSACAAGVPPGDVETSVYVVRPGDTVASILERLGLRDDASIQAFFRLNPRVAASGFLAPGQSVRLPAAAPAAPAPPAPAPSPVETSWTKGFGRRLEGQNDYNAAILVARRAWPDVDPLILKSILAQETGFDPRVFARNPYGYAGVAQLGIAEARAAGLKTGGSTRRRRGRPATYDRRNDERFDASRAVPAAAITLRDKDRALRNGITVASGRRLEGYAFYGEPPGDDRWRFAAAAYDGGQGTILRAMRFAYGDVPPPEVRWADLVRAPGGDVRQSPLWRAIAAVGMNPAVKYREISTYAADVVARARQ